jgi:Acetyltransferase (GNAT) domain
VGEINHSSTYEPALVAGFFVTNSAIGNRNCLQILCTRFKFLLQFVPDTTPVIAQAGQKAPFALLPQTTPPVDSLPSIVFSGLPVIPVKPRIHAEVGRYTLRLAQGPEDREAACRLRFKVFNIEMGEGLQRSYETGIDTDNFDIFCEHLLVEDNTDQILATTLSRSLSSRPMNLYGTTY